MNKPPYHGKVSSIKGDVGMAGDDRYCLQYLFYHTDIFFWDFNRQLHFPQFIYVTV